MKQKVEKTNNRQRGAIFIEATISLSTFMFAIFTLLYVIQMAYAQSRIAVSLDRATKEVAEYVHLYYATGMDQSLSGTGGKSSELLDEVSQFLETIGSDIGSVDGELGQYVTSAGTSLSGDSFADWIKTGLGATAIQAMMERNLASGSGTAEDFYRSYHISNMNLAGSSVLAEGSDNIFICAKYDMQVIQFLDIDVSFQMSTWAYAKAWGGQ